MKLEPPASHHVRAAEGWLELGNRVEARAELQKIEAALLEHPDVLEIRWQLQASEQDWAGCVETSAALVRLAPEKPFGWIHRAYALRRAPGGGLKIAYDSLLPAVPKFPRIWLIAYNLACYECQMGNMTESRSWLKRAAASGECKAVKSLALEDPDLLPLRDWIKTWQSEPA